MEKKATESSMVDAYKEFKQRHSDAVILLGTGDFFETFEDDAKAIHEILGVALTNRKHGDGRLWIAGFHRYYLDTYLPKIVRAGKRVAICEHLDDPATRKLVKRGIQ